MASYVCKFALDPASALFVVTTNAALVGGAMLVRKRGWRNVADWLVATAQMAVLAGVLTALSYVLASTQLPLQDATLVSIDEAVGSEWRALVDAMMRQPALIALLNYAYASLSYQIVLLLPVLFLTGHGRTGSQFVLAWSLTLAATVAIFPFVPALGGYLHFHLEPKDYPEVRILAAWLFAAPFHALRDGSLTVVELSNLDGIITFPSFHAAVAVLLAWASKGVPLLRWPMLALNLLMLISTVPVGGHYLIDVVAGSALAIAAILAARAWESTAEPGIELRPVGAEL